MKVSIPRKIYDEWEPTIKIKIKDHECYALCDLGASISTIPKTLCDILGFHDLDDCSLNLHLADSTIKKPMGRINDLLIVANRNLVPIDFIVLDKIAIFLALLFLVDLSLELLARLLI